MGVIIEKEASVIVSAKDFVEQCGIDDVACFANSLAEKLDQDFVVACMQLNNFQIHCLK